MAVEKRVPWDGLQEFVAQVFVRCGLTPEDAAIEAEVLVWANLRGVDSHGMVRVPGYVDAVAAGYMKTRPNVRIERETPATVLIEADHAFGPVVTKFAMNKCIEKARVVGVGWGVIRNTTHQGAMGYYALMAANEGMAGMTWVCNPPNMAPYGSRAPGVHNSPIAIAVPAKKNRPLILDMATSVAAVGKIHVAIDKGVSIPPGWALDKDGRPTTDPKLATIVLPFGSYKGSGLAMMFECLSSVMAGHPLLSPRLLGTGTIPPGTQNSVVAAVDINTFTDLEGFREDIDDLIAGIKALPPAEGFTEVLVPGEPEYRMHDDRFANGIPLPEGTVKNLRIVADKLGLAAPAWL